MNPINLTINESSIQDAPTISGRITSGVLLALFGIVGIPSNVINFYVFVSKNHRNKLRIRASTMLIFSNLIAADLIGSIINIPLCFGLFAVNYDSWIDTILSRIHLLITTPFLAINCACLILLSLDRHDAILRPHRYRLPERRLKLTLGISWLSSFVIGIWGFLIQAKITIWRPESFHTPTPNSLIIFFGITAVVCTIISNIKIQNALKPKKNEVISLASQHRLAQTRQQAERRIARAMVLITLTLVLTYAPWGGVTAVYRWKKVRFHANVYVICRVMLLISHVTQPFIYFGVSREFRHVIKSLFSSRNDEMSVTDLSTLRRATKVK